MESLVSGLVVAAVVGTGVVSGLLFIFSNTIMTALQRQGPEAGAATMISINEIILNPVFLLFFLGTALACLVVGALAIITAHDARALLITASAAYLAGVLFITMVVNVPLNERLARTVLGTEDARAFWQLYLVRWTRWNTVRTVAGMVSSVLFALAAAGM